MKRIQFEDEDSLYKDSLKSTEKESRGHHCWNYELAYKEAIGAAVVASPKHSDPPRVDYESVSPAAD